MMDIRGKHITVIGAARSGISAALLAKEQQAHVFVTDSQAIPENFKEILVKASIEFEENGHSNRATQCAFAVKSPGVPNEVALVQTLMNHACPVFSEVEFASWFCPGNMIAITGTNGKTTTTAWTGHLWNKANRRHVVAGNIGTAFSSVVGRIDDQTDAILEVSSFQLDNIDSFRPKISMILNITPDHLNRYGHEFSHYVKAKFRITENQTPTDFFICSLDSKAVTEHYDQMCLEAPARCLSFSTTREPEEGAFIKNGSLVHRFGGLEYEVLPLAELALNGEHNVQNAMAVSLAGVAMKIPTEVIAQALRDFEGVEHRLEFVRDLNGVKYVNDSKATNVNSVWYALQSFADPIVLIMGGQDKGNDYKEMASLIRSRVRTLIAIGEGKQKIKDQLAEHTNELVEAESLEEAISLARKKAQPFDVVLLSPACASFDMFKNFEHRGQEFKRIVNRLK